MGKPAKILEKEGVMADMAAEPQMGLTFERVWAALMETRASIQELREESKETDRQMKETDRQMKETDRLIRELREEGKETGRQMKETDRRMKELQKSMGYLDNRFGEMAEHLVAPNIVKKFNELGYHFSDVAKERKFFNEETGLIEAEFDVILENGEFSIGVEVKTKPAERDVREHMERLEYLRARKDKLGDKREVRGAIAGAIMPRNAREAALREGLYAIEQSGDTVRIEEPKNVRGW
jgi:chromosome segregation ATPase